jgi:hypothetical protein
MPTTTFRSRLSVAAQAVKGIFSDESLQQTHGLLGGIFPGSSGDPPARGDLNVLNAYNEMPWLRAVSQRVATAVASSATDWRLFAPTSRQRRDVRKMQRCGDKTIRSRLVKEAGDRLQPVEDHVLLTALNGANSYMVGQALFKTTQIHLDLVGEAFWLKERNGLGAPVAFWPLPSNWVQSTPSPSNPAFRVSFRGWQGHIPDSEILWMAEPDPTNPYGRGSGMGRALGDELETDEYAAKHTRQLFFNRARPDLLVWPKNNGPHDPGLGRDQVRRLEERWLDGHQGFWKAFKPFFVGREIGVHEVNQNLRELQMVELRQQQRDIVVQMFGIPPELLGILQNSNRSTIEAADYLFSRWVVQPRLEFLRAQLQERLIPEYDDRLIIDYVSPVQEDRDFMLKAAQAAPYSMTVDEWRVLQGQEPLADGMGSTHLIPNNLVSARTPYVEPAPVPATPAAPPVESPIVDSWDDALSVFKDACDGAAIADVKKILSVEDDLPELTDLIAEQEPKVFRMLRRQLNALNARATNENIQAAIEESLTVAAVWRIVGFDEWLRDLREAMDPHWLKAWRTGAEDAADAASVTLVKQGELDYFNTVNPEAVSWVEQHGATAIAELSLSSQQGIQQIISRSLSEGWDVARTAREIRSVVGLTRSHATAISNYAERLADQGVDEGTWQRRVDRYASAHRRMRAATIARTELSFASNAGQDQLWQIAKRGGVLNTTKLKRKLIVAGVGPCPICLYIAGEKPVAFDATFSNGLRHPPMHPNCRCTVGLTKG